MKRTPLKRKTPLRARRATKGPKLSAKTGLSTDTVPDCKTRIQALLRLLAIHRDGGCVLRHFPEEAGACGGRKNDGDLILQAEHLVTRANSISFGDMRNIVCICKHHHLHFKPQHSRLYWELIEHAIGYQRWDWVKKVEKDKRPHRMTLWDYQKIEMELTQQLKRKTK